MTKSKKIIWILIFTGVYLVSTVPVGLFIYSLKSENDIDIFKTTGFHSYMACLKAETQKAVAKPEEEPATEE